MKILSLTDKSNKKIGKGIELPVFKQSCLIDDIDECVYVRYKPDGKGNSLFIHQTFDQYLENYKEF